MIMEYQTLINILDNTPNQPPKLRTKTYAEVNDDLHRRCNADRQIKFNISMLSSSICGYSDTYIFVKGTITIPNMELADADPNNRNKKVIFKNCCPFTNCINEINNRETDHAKNIVVVIPINNLMKYNGNYSWTSGRLWQYYRDESALKKYDAIIDFPDDNDDASFKFNKGALSAHMTWQFLNALELFSS